MKDRYASLREGLVGSWIPSVSGSGLLLPDLSGQGNNGTLTNMGPEDWVAGEYGRALDFDGADDYVPVGNWNLGDSFTISTWAYLRDTSNLQALLAKHVTSTFALRSASIYITSGRIYGYIANGVTSASVNVSVTALVNSWLHIGLVKRNDNLLLYIDGAVGASGSCFAGDVAQTEQPVMIGRFSNAAGEFNGQLDDIRIYNRALSESEIKLLASRPGIGLRPQRRTMYYAPPTGARRRRILTSMP